MARMTESAVQRRARLKTQLLEASADLGANIWQTFRYVTLPLMAPGVLAAALGVAKDDLCQTRRRTECIPAFSTTDRGSDGCNRIALVVRGTLGTLQLNLGSFRSLRNVKLRRS